MIEWQSIINLSSYSIKVDSSVVLCGSDVAPLWQGENANFVFFLLAGLFIVLKKVCLYLKVYKHSYPAQLNSTSDVILQGWLQS